MLAAFEVGDTERHHIEVEQSFFRGRMTIRVDGNAVIHHKSRPFKFSYLIPFSVGKDEIHDVEIRVNYLTIKYEVYVDGKLSVGCLFPQAAGYAAFWLALIAIVMTVRR